jgi:hypothetical protein
MQSQLLTHRSHSSNSHHTILKRNSWRLHLRSLPPPCFQEETISRAAACESFEYVDTLATWTLPSVSRREISARLKITEFDEEKRNDGNLRQLINMSSAHSEGSPQRGSSNLTRLNDGQEDFLGEICRFIILILDRYLAKGWPIVFNASIAQTVSLVFSCE